MIDADPAESTRDTPVTPVSPGVAVLVWLLQQNTSVHNDVRAVTSESGCPLIRLLQARNTRPLAAMLALAGARRHRHGGQWPLCSELRSVRTANSSERRMGNQLLPAVEHDMLSGTRRRQVRTVDRGKLEGPYVDAFLA